MKSLFANIDSIYAVNQELNVIFQRELDNVKEIVGQIVIKRVRYLLPFHIP